MKDLKPALLVTAATLCLANAAPAFAGPVDKNHHANGNGWGPPSTRGAPGPLAGVGLPFLIVAGAAGAYRLIRRRKEESRHERADGEQG